MVESDDVELKRWSAGDLRLLQQTVGSPEMMEHLGGIETADQILRRHERYLRVDDPGGGGMFTVSVRADAAVVGTVGYWETTWQGETTYEAGWMVLPGYTGRGIATKAALLIVDRAKAERRHRFLHAFPSTANLASNSVCAKAGFALVAECTVEYPKGHFMRCNDWSVDLFLKGSS